MPLLFSCLSLVTRMGIWVLNKFGSGGTSLPGLWVERYAPALLAQYGKLYSKVIFITGTNGKTTTQLLVRLVLEQNGYKVVSNTSGSNMIRGIATILLLGGVPSPKTVLLCEVEEATMPILTNHIQADAIVITNFYRDQLDAYGELHKTASYVRQACDNCPHAVVIANADDPMVRSLLSEITHDKVTYSLGPYASNFHYELSPQVNPQTGSDYVVTEAQIKLDFSVEVTIREAKTDTTHTITSALSGMYNVYNIMACFAVSQKLALDPGISRQAIGKARAPFGRGEKIEFIKDNRKVTIQLFLVKNPAGFSQVWEMLMTHPTPADFVLGLNDNIADGRDVSWIWDIALVKSPNSEKIHSLYFTGSRAHDMALRLKYAEIHLDKSIINKDIPSIITDAITKNTHSTPILILATYTAMNQIREALSSYSDISLFTS